MCNVLSLSLYKQEHAFLILTAHSVPPEHHSHSHLSFPARRFLFGVMDGDVSLWGSWLGAQPTALGWLIVALSCHHGIFTLLIVPLSTLSVSRSSVTLPSKEKPPSTAFPGVFVCPIFLPCNPRRGWMHPSSPPPFPPCSHGAGVAGTADYFKHPSTNTQLQVAWA